MNKVNHRAEAKRTLWDIPFIFDSLEMGFTRSSSYEKKTHLNKSTRCGFFRKNRTISTLLKIEKRKLDSRSLRNGKILEY